MALNTLKCNRLMPLCFKGLTGVALEWISSFLSDWTQQITHKGRLFGIQSCTAWHPSRHCLRVPAVGTVYSRAVSHHHSTWAPCAYVRWWQPSLHLYTSPWCCCYSRPSLHVYYQHQRLDDGQLMVWLNPAKTQVMSLGSSQQLDKSTIRDLPLLSASICIIKSVQDISIIIDSQLSPDSHVCCVS